MNLPGATPMTRAQPTMHPRRGYTLFELMLVMALLVIISALAVPLIFEGLYGDTKVTTASDVVRARWADCRAQAVEEGRPYVFSVVPTPAKFTVAPCRGTPQGGSPLNPAGDAPNGKPVLVIEDPFPKGVRFGAGDTPVNAEADEPTGGDYVPVAIFLPDGTAQDDVE